MNWLKFAPYAAILLVAAWAMYERDGWQRAEKALLVQENQMLTDANKAWQDVHAMREDFDKKSREFIDELNKRTTQMESLNAEYKKAVAADPGGKVLLTPAQRRALQLFAPGANQNSR